MTEPCDLCWQLEDPPGDHTDTFKCPLCGRAVPFAEETHYIGEKLKQEAPVEVLEEGTVVKVDNADHVWHGEIALICGIKHKFYRLDLLGRKTWVPQSWVKQYEP